MTHRFHRMDGFPAVEVSPYPSFLKGGPFAALDRYCLRLEDIDYRPRERRRAISGRSSPITVSNEGKPGTSGPSH